MSPTIIFSLQLVLGYAAWLLCFGVYIMPRLKAMDRVAAHRAIAIDRAGHLIAANHRHLWPVHAPQ